MSPMFHTLFKYTITSSTISQASKIVIDSVLMVYYLLYHTAMKLIISEYCRIILYFRDDSDRWVTKHHEAEQLRIVS